MPLHHLSKTAEQKFSDPEPWKTLSHGMLARYHSAHYEAPTLAITTPPTFQDTHTLAAII